LALGLEFIYRYLEYLATRSELKKQHAKHKSPNLVPVEGVPIRPLTWPAPTIPLP